MQCTWRPGSMTHVRLAYGGETAEVPFERVVRLFGRVALDAMYLRGRFSWHATSGFALGDV